MAFNIKDERIVERARFIADRTGESITDAIGTAIEERARRLERDDERRRARVMRLIAESAEMIRASGREIPDIDEYLYDSETGLPK